jgi:hypothetical protein
MLIKLSNDDKMFGKSFCDDLMISGDDYEDSRLINGYSCHMTLKIRSILSHQFGSYRCVAVNALGETDGFIKVYGKYSFIILPIKSCFRGKIPFSFHLSFLVQIKKCDNNKNIPSNRAFNLRPAFMTDIILVKMSMSTGKFQHKMSNPQMKIHTHINHI